MRIPLTFEIGDEDYEGLSFTPEGDGCHVQWPDLGISVHHAGSYDQPDFADMLTRTPQLKLFGRTGFAIAKYGEFLVENLLKMDEFRFGSVEVSFGQPTMLFRYLFDRHHRRKYMGEWDELFSCRIVGVQADDVELVLLNGFAKYEELHGILPSPSNILEFDWMAWQDKAEAEPEAHSEGDTVFPSAVLGDIEPLRCMFYATNATEPAAACIQFYRVLEFYAFLSLTRNMGVLRRDSDVSDREFLFKSAQLLTKEEKGPIIKLVADLATKDLLDFAVAEGLVKGPDRAALGNALYDFRNSIVHAKQDQRVPLTVDSVLLPSKTTKAWRHMLHQLALKALKSHSTIRHLD